MQGCMCNSLGTLLGHYFIDPIYLDEYLEKAYFLFRRSRLFKEQLLIYITTNGHTIQKVQKQRVSLFMRLVYDEQLEQILLRQRQKLPSPLSNNASNA